MKKLTICVLVVATMFCFAFAVAAPAKAETEMLYVMNWGEYIGEGLVDEFEVYYKQETGRDIEVIYSEQDTNEAMITQVVNFAQSAGSGKMNLDLLCPSEYAIQKLIERGYIQSLKDEKEEFWGDIQELFTVEINKTFGNLEINGEQIDLTDYFVPYMMGTLGIMYNTDYVTQEDLEQGWGLLWNAASNPLLDKKIYMKDSIRDAYVAAVMRLKELNQLPDAYKNLSVQELINNSDDQLIELAEQILKDQKAVVMGYSVDFDKKALEAGTAYVDLAWSGDAIATIEEAAKNGINLDYFIPESGSNIWFDGWVIPEKAQNPQAAKEFVKFLNIPVNAMRNMMEIGYTSAVKPEILIADQAAIDILLDNEYTVEEFFSNPVQYYAGEIELGVMKDFGSKETGLINMWERVKAHGNDLTIILIIVGVVVVIGIIAGIVIYTKSRKTTRRKVN